jgi:hypothetical protein
MAKRLPEMPLRWILCGQSESTHITWSLLALYLVYRYCFPTKPIDGIIDLTAGEQPFYFNAYSGELSLEFPKAEMKCKGGILACAEFCFLLELATSDLLYYRDGNAHFSQTIECGTTDFVVLFLTNVSHRK